MTALDLIRDRDIDFPTLQRHFGRSEAFVAGLIDAVTGDDDWRQHAEGAIPAGEAADYDAGFRHGLALLDEADFGPAGPPLTFAPPAPCDLADCPF